MVKLSALVCVQSQDTDLSECLRRLWFCDEIVVVADRCSAASIEIATRHGATVVAGIFPLESQRRAAGLEAASGDWILEIAPEERVDSALAWEIRATLKMGPQGDWFEIPLANYVGAELVRGGWNGRLGAAREVRLYRPGSKSWAAKRSDAGRPLGVPAGALVGELRRELGAGVGELFERFNRLTALEAEDLADAAALPGPARALRQGLAGLFGSYVGRRGWREGGLGLALAAMSGLYPVVSQLKAEEVVAARAHAAKASGDGDRVVRLGVG